MRVGFIGGGRMAEAMIGGLLRAGVAQADAIAVAEPDPARRDALGARFGVAVHTDNAAVARAAPVVVLAVKPQILDEVCRAIEPELGPDRLAISIAAGKRLDRIEALLPRARVVRVMPNLPAVVGAAMSVFCPGTRATPDDEAATERLLSAFGHALKLDESLFDAVTALSGSGPAFFAYLTGRMAAAGEALGLPRAAARRLAAETLAGTARLLTDGGYTPDDLVTAVASPQGTTAAGLAVLATPETDAIVQRTLAAAARRSRELSGATPA